MLCFLIHLPEFFTYYYHLSIYLKLQMLEMLLAVLGYARLSQKYYAYSIFFGYKQINGLKFLIRQL